MLRVLAPRAVYQGEVGVTPELRRAGRDAGAGAVVLGVALEAFAGPAHDADERRGVGVPLRSRVDAVWTVEGVILQ